MGLAERNIIDIEAMFPTEKHRAADTFRKILHETHEQPAWRMNADREADYVDGNQLDAEALTRLQDLGIPPSIENLVAGAVKDVLGMEAKQRTDFKCIPDGDIHDQEADLVARALGYKLNKAERASGCDRACSQAYASQVKVGVGWVEVSRNPNRFQYPYRVKNVHRNEMWWDWLSRDDDISDARWLLRRRWSDIDVVAQMWPEHRDLIAEAGTGWNIPDDLTTMLNDGAGETDLAQSWEIERGWAIEDMEWRMPYARRICLFELWTRSWEQGLVLNLPDGRVIEFDQTHPDHQLAAYVGMKVEKSMITRVKRSFLLGPHLLQSNESEFERFPYVPFWADREDRTNVPYGIVRNLIYLQDEVNSRISKMQWLLAAKRSKRTKGAVQMSDDVFRYEMARPDADIILDESHMKLPGAVFEIEDDMPLNDQQFSRLMDLRESIKKISGISDAFSGDGGADTASGLNTMIEQTVQSLADLNDNFAYSRMQVGDLLLGLIIRDMGSSPQNVMMYADNPLRETVEVQLNQPILDPETGRRMLTNDVQRTKIKVTLEEVPSTPSFRRQALVSLSEAFKSANAEHQQVMLPHLMNLTDVPDKDAIIEAILEINRQKYLTPEQVEEAKQAAVEEALTKKMSSQKDRELDLKERLQAAQIEKLVQESVAKAIEAIYSATQTGAQIVALPGAAPAADQVLNSAGFEDKDQRPIVAEPGAASGLGAGPPPPVRQNTSPGFPPRLQGPEPGGNPAVGVKNGIEKQGVQ